MAQYKVKDASAFPQRSQGQYAFREMLAHLRAGKSIEIPVEKGDAVKVRRSLIASMRRWLTDGEKLKTAISDHSVFAVLAEKLK